jgi:ribosomal protein S18 acetylase RimI-like enzyme
MNPLRRFDRDRDIEAMLALALASPDANLHTVDLPYRLCSWALDEPDNVGLWEDDAGRLAAWATLQAPFWAIDIAARPDIEDELFPRALAWAEARARDAAGTPYGRPSWYVHVFGDQERRLRQLDRAEFACQADVGEDSWSRVLLRRSGRAPATIAVPDGFTIRPLAGPNEVDAYVELHQAAFESKNMTAEWRSRTLGAPHHREENDLVAVAPDGRLAGFCIGWLAPGRDRVGQIEPLGIAREFRERGVGHALLAECVRRLVASGARRVLVETDTYRTPALGLYESLGFEPVRDVLVYRKDAPTTPAL